MTKKRKKSNIQEIAFYDASLVDIIVEGIQSSSYFNRFFLLDEVKDVSEPVIKKYPLPPPIFIPGVFSQGTLLALN